MPWLRRLGSPIAAGIALALLACGGAPLPREHFYRLSADAPPEPREQPILEGTLVVRRFEADGLLMQRPLLYSDGDAGNVQQYHYHSWVDAPTRMLQEDLATYLREANAASAVVTPRTRVVADYEITGRVKRLERVLGGSRPPQVLVDVEISLRSRAEPTLLLLRDYRVEQPAPDDSIPGAVAALRAALTQLYGAFERDLEAL